ncbi:MAG: RluA family pseudouridine synthase [Planctomycetaceae bacterium]
MSQSDSQQSRADEEPAPTVLAALRGQREGLSWSAARRLLQSHCVAINGVLCVDEARRLTPGETLSIGTHPFPAPPSDDDVAVLHVDQDIVVVDKPSGMVTLRRLSERSWSAARRAVAPTLDEAVPRLIARHAADRRGTKLRQRRPQLLSVHRIDRDTSGLLVFARNEESKQKIIQQFAEHAAVRRYLAVIPGTIVDQTIRSQLIRDRGDGLRGSTSDTSIGQHAVTHVSTLRRVGEYSELECRLETGRTNQIRIHLAELGHPVCGDIKYRGPVGVPGMEDFSNAPRLALHAAELRFVHPTTGETMHFELPWPVDMRRFLNRLQAGRR